MISTDNTNSFSEVADGLNQQQHLVSGSSSQLPYKAEAHRQEQYTIIPNHGQLAEQVVPSTSSPSYYSLSQHHHLYKEEKVLLLNHQQQQLQQQQQRQKTRGQRDCQQQHGCVVSVTLDEVDCDMGQSHDSESVFSQSVSIASRKLSACSTIIKIRISPFSVSPSLVIDK